MVTVGTLQRAAIALLMAAAPAVWYACAEPSSDSPTAPATSAQRGAPPHARAPDLRAAIAAQRRHTDPLLRIPGVVGTAVGLGSDGRPGVQILLERPGIPGLPAALDGIPVTHRVTGRLMAFSDPTQRQRPAPAGFSVGHPAITAGTIGARVRDATGRVYILSNNHVLANSNNAEIGDPQYQPGPFDGGTAADQIATLSDFQAITFSGTATNTMDAAIALSSTDLLDNAVPGDDGYGTPNATIYGDGDGDGLFDDPGALLGLNVQKYGRTTRLTHGQITGVHGTITVCYAVSGFSCTKAARFVDQLLISPGAFSGGGDSGSLICTDDGSVNPVGLLFAGSSTVTVANRIDLVLDRFGVAIDGFAPPPPGPVTDVALTGVNVPGAIVVNTTAGVTVTVKNFGNQDVSSFAVTLEDTTEQVTVGTQTVAGLAAGATATVTLLWTPTTAGDHGLVSRHTLSDDKASNDERSVTIPVAPAVTDVSVTGMSVSGSVIEGHIVTVGVTVSNIGNQNVASSFDVTLSDATAGATLGSRTVAGLARGAAVTLTFSWDLTSAAVGQHTLDATHTLTDDNAANNRRTSVVTVSPKPLDLALTGITGPPRVTVGDTAHVGVTVKNVGEVDVATSFDVVLVEGTAPNVTVGAQTVAGLAVGAVTTVDIPWHTAGVAINNHILIARQMLADNNPTNNTYAIAINVLPPPDVAVSGVSAPAAVAQGSTAAVAVTVRNVGGQHVGGFDIVLTDQTAGLTIGTQLVPGLALGSSTTRTFNWNVANAALGGHTLVATHTLTDADAANNQGSAAVVVNAPSIDVALTGLSAPASVIRGSTATIGVTVQNGGGTNVATSFDIVLTDATAGVTIGRQTLSGLTAGAFATRYFGWNTASPPAALGGHTLTATHTLTDADAANNQRTMTVTVNAGPTDLALASIAAPGQVTVGDTAPVVVTVQNVGGQDVTTSFDVVLTDGTAGVTIGTQAIPGLAVGASAARTFNWNTGGAATGGHFLLATQKLADGNASNNARAITLTVNPPSVHVGNLGGVATITGDVWSATVQITAHDVKHNPLDGVTVRGMWNGSASQTAECQTSETEGSGSGTCAVVLSSIPSATRSVTFGVTGMTLAGAVYKPTTNHDPDGGSNGYSISVKAP